MMTNGKLPEDETARKARAQEIQEFNEIEAMLPWFAAGTLSRRDAARVEEALTKDSELAFRFELVREELGETIRLNEDLGAPSSRAMKTLFEKIDAEGPRQRAPSLNPIDRVSAFIAGFSPRVLAWSGAVAALAILLQAGFIASIVMNERGGTFRTVSYEQTVPVAQGSYVLVRFAPQATASEITKFLEDYKAVLVDGPKAGMFRVKLSANALPKEELARLAQQMQGSRLVTFAAPAP